MVVCLVLNSRILRTDSFLLLEGYLSFSLHPTSLSPMTASMNFELAWTIWHLQLPVKGHCRHLQMICWPQVWKPKVLRYITPAISILRSAILTISSWNIGCRNRSLHDLEIMMNRINAAFKNKPIFMPYFPLGYPDLDTSIDVIEALAKNGADLIEVGLSFSDPLADGPVIQHATQIALEEGITVKKSLEAVKELRKRGVDIPLVMMGYYNPMLAYGLEKFVHDAVEAGVDGFIVPDLPMEESEEFTSIVGADGCPPLPLIP